MSVHKSGRGRPQKNPAPHANVSDASLERFNQYVLAVDTVLNHKKYLKVFKNLQKEDIATLVNTLAHELLAYPALRGLVSESQPNKRGPKPRHDHAVFAATVRDKLEIVGVRFKQWDNGRNSRLELSDFCQDIIQAIGITGFSISGRTIRQSPEHGFHDGDFLGNSSDH